MSAPRVMGYVPGVYDMFHVGHLNILRRARDLCDELVVGAVTDEVVERTKGKLPVVPLAERMEILSSMAIVDRVVADDCTSDKLPMWERLGFDVLFKGDDWKDTPKANRLEPGMAALAPRSLTFPNPAGPSTRLLPQRTPPTA